MHLSFCRGLIEEAGGGEQVSLCCVAQWAMLKLSQGLIKGLGLLSGQGNIIRKGCLQGTTPPSRAKVLREQAGGSFYVTVK